MNSGGLKLPETPIAKRDHLTTKIDPYSCPTPPPPPPPPPSHENTIILTEFNRNDHFAISHKATPIYLLVLHAQEVGNEPFWNLKKS